MDILVIVYSVLNDTEQSVMAFDIKGEVGNFELTPSDGDDNVTPEVGKVCVVESVLVAPDNETPEEAYDQLNEFATTLMGGAFVFEDEKNINFLQPHEIEILKAV